MPSLIAYLDASGSVVDPNCRIFTVAGYIATEERWKSFAMDWQRVFFDFGVKNLHMKDFAHSHGEFQSWKGNESRRAQFLMRLVEVIRLHLVESFGVSLNMTHYRKVDKAYKVTESLGAYAMVAGAAIGTIEKWQRLQYAGNSLAVCIEKGDAQQHTLLVLSARTVLKEGLIPKFISKKKGSDSDKECFALQAADFLAYEQAKCLTDWIVNGKTIGRESLFHLSDRQRTGSQTWRYLDKDFVLLSCRIFNVPERTYQ